MAATMTHTPAVLQGPVPLIRRSAVCLQPGDIVVFDNDVITTAVHIERHRTDAPSRDVLRGPGWATYVVGVEVFFDSGDTLLLLGDEVNDYWFHILAHPDDVDATLAAADAVQLDLSATS